VSNFKRRNPVLVIELESIAIRSSNPIKYEYHFIEYEHELMELLCEKVSVAKWLMKLQTVLIENMRPRVLAQLKRHINRLRRHVQRGGYRKRLNVYRADALPRKAPPYAIVRLGLFFTGCSESL
jgi:hypothetical protein